MGSPGCLLSTKVEFVFETNWIVRNSLADDNLTWVDCLPYIQLAGETDKYSREIVYIGKKWKKLMQHFVCTADR